MRARRSALLQSPARGPSARCAPKSTRDIATLPTAVPNDAAASAARTVDAALDTLACIDLACRRGNRLLFKGVNLEVRAGQAVWLRGRNGRGKTSLLRLAAGLAVPESGQVSWGGVDVRRASVHAAVRVYIGHANALEGRPHGARIAAVPGPPARPRARRASLHGRARARGHGLAARCAWCARCRKGQRRRAALARLALERSAALWILDEPYDALDVDGIDAVNRLLHEHLARGGSVLLTSHLPPGAGAPDVAEFDLDPFAAG